MNQYVTGTKEIHLAILLLLIHLFYSLWSEGVTAPTGTPATHVATTRTARFPFIWLCRQYEMFRRYL
ncbi:hypothetical protein EFV92_11120 [Yersinia enterocolitica]|nr:hypothetical protein [Yersinia enterocolitica]EKN5069490.1 hypothetical protein [Yersinia enterocolitica]EKN5132077.1 hypothetical protein [Yersinia enterocolitica]